MGLPAATRIARTAERENLARERAGQASALERDRAERARLEEEIPSLELQMEQIEQTQREHEKHEQRARSAYVAAAQLKANAEAAARTAEELITTARVAVGDVPLTAEQADARQEAALAARQGLAKAEHEHRALAREIDELEAGRPVRPAQLDDFRRELEERGIGSQLIAEKLEVRHPVAAEAALGDGVWALVIDRERLPEAVELARDQGYRLPLAASGNGEVLRGALAEASGADEALAYLAEVELPIGDPGVSETGLVRGYHWAAWRAPERPVLGQAARAARLVEARRRADEVSLELPVLSAEARRLAAVADAVARAVPAAAELDVLLSSREEATAASIEAESAWESVQSRAAESGRELGRIETRLGQDRSRLADLIRRINASEPQLETYDQRLRAIDDQLAELPELPADLDAKTLPGIEALEREAETIAERIEDETRFPPEVRTELVLAHHEAQDRSVTDAELLLGGRRQDLEAVGVEVDRARERYDQHIRQVVHLLARRFRDVCEQAGMDGDIELRAGEIEGEFGIDVKVAHVRGDAKRSYRDPVHSSGQRAKISLLVLLAAMGLEGSADLLIMDEHAAHLDSRNIDAVAEVMNALRHRVQFILATPTNAEAARLAWCDHQIAFYPRRSGEPFAPPVRLYTRMPEDGERYAEMGQLALAD